MSYNAAVPSLIAVVFLTFLMGMIKQMPSSVSSDGFSIFNSMLSFWPFILVYIWMTSIVGLVSIKYLFSFRVARIPFLLNHLGLFIALVSATLGSADSTGKALPYDKPEHLLLEDGVNSGKLSEWKFEILDRIEMAALVSGEDTVRYVEWPSTGATYAVNVKAVSCDGKRTASGWVSCGSFLFPYQALRLDSICSLVMPDREPRRFSSDVVIYTESGKKQEKTIEVNKPADIENWKIYQLSYDESKGRWSDISVFELVLDPWLPAVYVGIIMMMFGAVCMFVTAQKKNN